MLPHARTCLRMPDGLPPGPILAVVPLQQIDVWEKNTYSMTRTSFSGSLYNH